MGRKESEEKTDKGKREKGKGKRIERKGKRDMGREESEE